jgi:polar amino acid transport system substrate-binding protein
VAAHRGPVAATVPRGIAVSWGRYDHDERTSTMDIDRPTRPQRRSGPLALAVGLLALMGLLATACGGDDDGAANGNGNGEGEGSALLRDARENGITIGIANERPYGYEEGGEATGEAPELAKEIFSRMGIDQVDFQVVEFGALINGLNAGRFDVIAAGMFINPERAEQVAFADPDYCGTTAFAVPEGNPDGLTDFQSVVDAEVTLGVLSGAVEEGYAVDSGVPEGQISAFQTTPDLFDALDAGRIDAATLTAITVREQVEDLEGYEATEGFVPVVDGEEQLGCGAFAFSQENEDFRNEFNEILNEMKENDEILPIIEEFGFTEAEVEAARGVTVEDLAG